MGSRSLPGWAILYCVFHLCVAGYPIRSWPLTDYPMFSDPIYPETPLVSYRYYGVTENSLQPLPRAALSGYGLGDLNVTKLYLEGDRGAFKKILVSWLSRPENRDVQSIELHKVTLHRANNRKTGALQESVEVLFKLERGSW